jgi:hypothetical protein
MLGIGVVIMILLNEYAYHKQKIQRLQQTAIFDAEKKLIKK